MQTPVLSKKYPELQVNATVVELHEVAYDGQASQVGLSAVPVTTNP